MRQVFATLAMVILSAAADAADWPMWRYDAARSAASPDPIGTNLTLLWSRKLPPVRPAWPLEEKQRLDFDASYEPLVMGKLLFVGSPNDGTINAYDTDTGEEQWTFYTEGPIRCAPACGKGNIIFGSDDGYLYCLNANTGRLVWKFRGAPADRPDRRQLGNGHLVSFWPVRGGPVLKDGIVYFGVGIWPMFGVFIYAIDADSGKVKWLNKDLNYLSNVREDHDNLCESALSPQGHLVIAGDKLLVPNGRSMPAGLELATGKLIYYAQGNRNGDSRVAAHESYAFAGKTGMVNLYDFREAGSAWAYRGSQAPEGYEHQNFFKRELYESPYDGCKLVEGCDASSAFENGVAYGYAQGTFYAYDVRHSRIYEREQDGYLKIRKIRLLTWEPKLLWQLKGADAKQPGTSPLIKAGDRLYGGVGKAVLALENLKGPPKVAWSNGLDSAVSSVIAADRKLFVATKAGWIYSFGEGPSGKQHNEKPPAPGSAHDGWKDKTERIVKATGVNAGYCLVLGLDDGRLIEELLRQTDMTLFAVDPEPSKIEALKRRFSKAGLLGSRIELFHGSPLRFPFPPYLASLIVSEKRLSPEVLKTDDIGGLFDTLHPYGGTLCLEIPESDHAALGKIVTSAKLANAALKRYGELSLILREGALPGSAPWTHHQCDAEGTSCSRDELVRPPLGCLWYGDTHVGYVLQKAASGGRIFTIRHRWLLAYDAYTGRSLWQAKVDGGQIQLAAMSDAVYVACNGKCFVYEPATGRLLNTFLFDKSPAIHVRNMRVGREVILLSCSDQNAWWTDPAGAISKTLICLDRESGTELWRRTATNHFSNRALVLTDETVFCMDHVPFDPAWRAQQKAGIAVVTESTTLAIEARTGKTVWEKHQSCSLPDPHSKKGIGLPDDWMLYSPEHGILVNGRYTLATGREARSGKELWEGKEVFPSIGGVEIFNWYPINVRGRSIVFSDGATYDLSTGNPAAPVFKREAHGCNAPVAGAHIVMIRDNSVAYMDIDTGKSYHTRIVRSGCNNDLIAADGLLSVPGGAGGCVCNYPIQTSFALIHMPETAAWSGSSPLIMNPPPALPDMEFRIKRIRDRSAR